ncbi:receptor-like serine/threonine-protein kinase ALE2 [Primulina tabacum]|uniref:receptor-like serine/threonine-protein kinase ALE2 n=1 Tax=Primulina tabacum TaxID=48773 RepID=UPI003F59C2B4
MELQMSFLVLEICLILCAMLFQESTGLSLQSSSVASLLHSIKVRAPNYGGKWDFMLLQNDVALSPTSAHTSSEHSERGTFAAEPDLKTPPTQSPAYNPSIGSPNSHKLNNTSNVHKNHHLRKKIHHFAPKPYHQLPSGPRIISPSPSPLPAIKGSISSRQLPLPANPQNHHLNKPSSSSPSPAISPTAEKNEKSLPPILSLTSPSPQNQWCMSVTCSEPLTYAPPGAPCGCVWPIEIKLLFSISLYSFFPLVSELAVEISTAIPLEKSQVRIVGADAVDQQLEKTTVLIKLVPLEQNFKAETAISIYTRFWKRDISIKKSVFGTYEVLDVRYPGLPPSPPSHSFATATIDGQPFPSSRNDDGPVKPFGVDVTSHRKKESSKSIVVITILSSVTAFVLFIGCLWLVLSKWGFFFCPRRRDLQGLIPLDKKTSGGNRLLAVKSGISSASMSFSSSLVAYTGTAKVFSIDDIERATDNYNTSRKLGEGGFGLVYGGVLDDGRQVAVKVLKRDDQQGSREFLAEVEMLSRLHHRNLVKLIGICPEDRCRCLVYELVPNGSVESHLHGVDKEIAPLDWCSRMKIALGAARGLAYLHEDSSPRVIHRDFKSSNILLEDDYTPKVSDFGLARTAADGGDEHFSTRVMGTFGYLAPEYAMTGHLLVKSDVYSYGVVLLELLTGRKPVDLTQPPGQENLVTWARPLLTFKNGLETIIDPTLKPNVPLDSVSKVAAIASMCVQPEVSHRPFMGEVVQALKLVCNDFEETREQMSRSCSQEDFLMDIESKRSRTSAELVGASGKYDSSIDAKIALSAVDLKNSSVGFEGQESESFRRQFNSAPLVMGRKKKFWQKLKGLSRGSMSEHEFSSEL